MGQKKISVSAYTPGINIPSRRFRIAQYQTFLEKNNIEVREYCGDSSELPKNIIKLPSVIRKPITSMHVLRRLFNRVPSITRSYQSDLVWLQRMLLPGYLSLEIFLKSPVVLDVDDAIWLDKPLGHSAARRVAKLSKAVIVGNSYLANWFGEYCDNIFIVPTAINTDIFKPRKFANNLDRDFIIGWTGTSGNFKYLYQIEDALSRFLKNHPRVKLLIVSDKMPKFNSISKESVVFKPWQPSIEASVINEMDIGIMPLEDNEWTRGKCSFKMLQYMASGVPVVVSAVGMNNEVLEKGKVGYGVFSNDEWYDALKELYFNSEKCKEFGSTGRDVVLKNYSTEIVANHLSNVFRKMLL